MEIKFQDYGAHTITAWIDHMPAASFDRATGEITMKNVHPSNPMHDPEIENIVKKQFDKWSNRR